MFEYIVKGGAGTGAVGDDGKSIKGAGARELEVVRSAFNCCQCRINRKPGSDTGDLKALNT